MATIVITDRKTGSGKRYDVRYRLGGRGYPVVRAGTFKTEREAKARKALVAGEIAHGRNPADLLGQMTSEYRANFVSFEAWAERFLASRIDVDENTKKNYRSSTKVIAETFGARDPATITATEIAEWIASKAETKKPGTLGQYRIAFRLLLDHIGVEPNPARDPRVRIPKQVREEPVPPPAEHVEAILATVGKKLRLLLITIEQGGLRLGEAVSLRWGDVDAASLRLRISRSATKRDKSKWVYVPQWLMDAIEATCPLEDRVPDRHVFQGVTEATAYQAMTRACLLAKVPHYHPHDLRHRRATIWHQSGVPARELAERLGHSRPSISLDVYSHVMPADEVAEERFQALLV
jgi:integrase